MANFVDLDAPEAFTAGTVGPPGQRVFFLQARQDDLLVSLKCEKQQVAALAEYLEGLISDLPLEEPAITPPELVGPGEPDWVVGSLAVAYDSGADRIVVVADELVGEGEDARRVRMAVTRPQAQAFVIKSSELMSSGRPPCVLCGQPAGPEGHACPRAN